MSYKLYNGDCLDLMCKIPDNSIDLVLCDLPYGTTACSWDSVIPFDRLWSEYKRVITDVGVICLFGQEPFSSLVRTSNLEMYRYDWVWQKQKPSNFQLMGYQCGRVHENIMIFSKSKACYIKGKATMVYNPQVEGRAEQRVSNAKIYSGAELLHSSQKAMQDNVQVYDVRQPISVLKFNGVEHREHPTQKPTDLLEYLIRTYSNEGDTVLDNTMGSGSTGVACLNTNRNFIGIELDSDYFEIAKRRLFEVNGERAEQIIGDSSISFGGVII